MVKLAVIQSGQQHSKMRLRLATALATVALALVGSAVSTATTLIEVPTATTVSNVSVTSGKAGTVRVFVDSDRRPILETDAARVELAFPSLRHVGGAFFVLDASAALVGVQAPRLETVAGDLAFANLPGLERIAVPELRSVDENLLLRLLPWLADVAFPRLLAVSRTLAVDSCGALETIELTALRTIGLHLDLNLLKQLSALALPQLRETRYDFLVRNCRRVAIIDAPLLRLVGEDLVIDGLPELTTLELPRLERVGEDCEVVQCLSLPALSLPRLMSVTEDLELRFNPRLRSVHLPRLQSVGEDVQIENEDRLVAFDAPVLCTIGEDLEVVTSRTLSTLRLPALRLLGGDLLVASCASLEAIELPALKEVQGSVSVYNNRVLMSVDLARVVSILGAGLEPPGRDDVLDGIFVFAFNDKLPTLTLPALRRLGVGATLILENAALQSLAFPALRELAFRRTRAAPVFAAVDNPELVSIVLNAGTPEPARFNLNAGNDAEICPTSPDVHPGDCPQDSWFCAQCGLGGDLGATQAQALLRLALCSGGSAGNNADSVIDSGDGVDGPDADADEGGSDSWLRAFCAGVGACAPEAPRAGQYEAWIDAHGCLDLSLMLGGAATAAGSVTLSPRDTRGVGVGVIKCVVAGKTLSRIDGCLSIIHSNADSIDLSGLRSIEQSLLVEGNARLRVLRAPQLRAVEKGELDLAYNGGIGADFFVELPAFQKAPIGVRIAFNLGGMSLVLSQLGKGKSSVGTVIIAYNRGLLTVDLLALSRAPEIFIAGNDQNVAINMPSLRHVFAGDLAIASSSALQRVAAPRLERVHEDLELFFLASLPSLELPKLVAVEEDAKVHDCAALMSLALGSLSAVGEDVELYDCWSLRVVDVSALTRVEEDFEAYLLHSLPLLSLPTLVSIGEDLICFGNPSLRRLLAPRLRVVAAREGGGMLIENNAKLQQFGLPSLRVLGNRTARLCPRERRGAPSQNIIGAEQTCDGSAFVELYFGATRVPAAGQRPLVVAHHSSLGDFQLGRSSMSGVALRTNVWVDFNADLARLSLGLDGTGSLLDAAYFFARRDLGVAGFAPLPLSAPLLQREVASASSAFCVAASKPRYATTVPAPGLREELCNATLRCDYQLATGDGRCSLERVPFMCAVGDPQGCTDAYYLYARENAFDFEENAVYLAAAPQFSAFRLPMRPPTGASVRCIA